MEFIFENISNSTQGFLKQVQDYIDYSEDFDCNNIDLDFIHTPIAVIKTNSHHLIYTNKYFREKFNLDDNKIITQKTLEDYIKPYDVEQIFNLSRDNSAVLMPKISSPQNFTDSFYCDVNISFQWYSLCLNTVMWHSEEVMIAIFNPLFHNSTVDLSLQLSKFASSIHDLSPTIYQCRNYDHSIMKYISENCYHLTGYDAHEFCDHTINYKNLIYHFDQYFLWQKIQVAIANHSIFEIEYRIIHQSGEIKWVWEQGKGIYSDTGELLYLEGLIVDINDKHQKEQEKSLLVNITQAITSAIDFETALLYTLQKVCQLTHWDFGEAWLPDKTGETFRFSAAWFSPQRNYQLGDSLSLTEFKKHTYNFHFSQTIGLPGKIWATKKGMWLQEISQSKIFLRAKLASQCGLKTGFGIPIMAQKEVVAILIFFSRHDLPTDKNFLGIIESIASQLGKVFKHKQIEMKLHQSQRELSTTIDSTSRVFFRISYDDNWG